MIKLVESDNVVSCHLGEHFGRVNHIGIGTWYTPLNFNSFYCHRYNIFVKYKVFHLSFFNKFYLYHICIKFE